MSGSTPWIVLVALDEPRLPRAEQIVQRVRQHAPHAAPPKVSSEIAGSCTFTWECPAHRENAADRSATFNVTLIDKPIPWDRLEGPCATAWYWPEAERVLRPHRAQLFVTMLDEGRNLVDRAERLTQFAAATAEASGGVGILWGPSSQVHQPQAFAQLAATSTPDNLPLHLWIDFRVVELSSGVYSMFTTGLEALGFRELETHRFAGDPVKLAGYAYNIAHYLIEKTPQLQEGQAIGLPDSAQATIEFAPSMIDPSQQALKLTFE